MPFTPPWATEITREHSALGIIDMQSFFKLARRGIDDVYFSSGAP